MSTAVLDSDTRNDTGPTVLYAVPVSAHARLVSPPEKRSPYPRVTAAEKYAEGPRPWCTCHREPMTWHSDTRNKEGGLWRCSVALAESRARSREAKRKGKGKGKRKG